ncbi:MAG: class I SAM-dependent methyltransferase [Alphaproteobacteria bacterium]
MDRETIAVYDAKFEDYANLFTSDKPSASLLRFINAVAPEGSVVDLGCGPGNSARAMAVSGLKVTAVDASAGMISLVEGTPNITAVQADFSWLDQTAAFDGIWANFSLLHAEREAFAGHLRAAAGALKPGGIFHLGMKTGEGTKRDALGRRYSYFTRSEFELMLLNEGFDILHVKEGEEVGLAGNLDPFILILSRRQSA